jgi:hypothetical protein
MARAAKDLEDQFETAMKKGRKGDEFKLPKTLAACADLFYQTKQARLAQQKIVDELKARESLLENHLIDNLPKSEATGVAGKVARASVITKIIPTVNDWDELYKHIKKTGNFELLQRRLSETAVKERWEEKKVVPGVGTFNKITISVTKV